MMNVLEKIIERLKQRLLANDECRKTALSKHNFDSVKYFQSLMFEDETIISIVHEEVESYNNGWIPCSERLPEESGEYLTWVSYDNDYFISIDEIDCDGIIKKWNCTYKVIAWQPLPQPYKERDTNGN